MLNYRQQKELWENEWPSWVPSRVDFVLPQFRGNHCPSAPAQPAMPARGLGFRKMLAEHPISLLPGAANGERLIAFLSAKCLQADGSYYFLDLAQLGKLPLDYRSPETQQLMRIRTRPNHREANTASFHLWEVLTIVKFIGSEWDGGARGWGGGSGELPAHSIVSESRGISSSALGTTLCLWSDVVHPDIW